MNALETGKFISSKRREKGLTQKELAEKLGVTDKAVSKWETGRGMPDVSVLEDLSKELEVSVSEILNGGEVEREFLPETADKIIVDTMKDSSKKVSRKRLMAIGVGVAAAILVLCISVTAYLFNSTAAYDDTEKLAAMIDENLSFFHDTNEKTEILKMQKERNYLAVLYRVGDQGSVTLFKESSLFPGRYTGTVYMTSLEERGALHEISQGVTGDDIMLIGTENLPEEACYYSFEVFGNDQVYEIASDNRDPFLAINVYHGDNGFPTAILLNKDKQPLYDEFGQKIEENWK